jgi:endonuclease YncB( thermonuclease family)
MKPYRQRRHRRYRDEAGVAPADRLWGGLFTILILGAALWSGLPQLTGSLAFGLESSTDFTGRVTRVVDGDTFWIDSAEVRIRIWGLDAPERDRAGGSAATAELSRLIAGRTLTCRQRDIDRYGRIVGQCFLPDGRDITAAMIASGTAREFCRFSGNHYRTC